MTETTSGQGDTGIPRGGAAPVGERMQSLLNLAVEDQATEQRHLALVLEEMRVLLARIDERLHEPAEASQLTRLTQLVTTLSTTVGADTEESVEQLRGLRATVEAFAEFPPALSSSLMAVQEELAVLQGRIAGLGTPGEVLETLMTSVQPLERVDDLRNEVAALAASVQERPDRQDAENQHASLLGRFELLEGRLAAVEDRVVQLPGVELGATLSSLGERLEGVAGGTDLIEVAGRMVARLDALETVLGERVSIVEQALDLRHDGLSDRLDDLAERFGLLEEGLSVLTERAPRDAAGRKEIGALTSQVAQLARVPDEMGQLAALLTPESMAAATGKAVASELTTLREDVARLAAATPADSQAVADRLAEDVAIAVGRTLERAVGRTVADAVTASERRLSAHVDEAVLALAEALLRRRSGVARPASVVPPAAPAVAGEGSPEDPPTPETAYLTEAAYLAEEVHPAEGAYPGEERNDQAVAPDAADGPAEPEERSDGPAQKPDVTAAPVPTESDDSESSEPVHAGAGDEAGNAPAGRRRSWWRAPGAS